MEIMAIEKLGNFGESRIRTLLATAELGPIGLGTMGVLGVLNVQIRSKLAQLI